MSELKDLYRTAVTHGFPDTLTLGWGSHTTTYRLATWPDGDMPVGIRYGENPHQPSACYVPEGAALPVDWLKLGKGGPSWTNLADIDHALRILRFLDAPAAAIMKHLNPSGVAIRTGDRSWVETYRAARDCDARAAFGGVAVFNREVDAELARELLTTYLEVIAAPAYSPEALEVLGAKKDLRVARIPEPSTLPRFLGEDGPPDLKVLTDGSILLQRAFRSRITGSDDLIAHPVSGGVRVERSPSAAELQDLLLAWYVAAGVRSNAVVFVRDGQTLAVGTGEQERVGAVEQAIAKARQKGHVLDGAAVASDAFFPFRDAIDALAAAGVTAIVQPGGSMRDAEVITACNEQALAMVFTGERCFGHF
ncbi:MAG: IMP cyclohydrolase [bacterium]|nr:IMP cyclohydrolase [bacterium]